ncbi:uncharacterized protein LOC100123381 isoform X1 [Nasonia vitripennis]|uniref:CHK kinase-like domain-containing protein n=2 Tax=Nasonia vitripennis TaxID=7425 RepID=A0A7M7ITC5_NASVI|nr:uncharacterized protein LOC100123381 isoform X1 [Nasonia vitripennis]
MVTGEASDSRPEESSLVAQLLHSMASPKAARRKQAMAISPEDVKLIVGRAIGGPADILDYQLRGFSDLQTGFSGSHQRLEITIKRQPKPEDDFVTEKLGFFAKLAPTGPPLLLAALAVLEVRKKEMEFFEQIAPRLYSYAPGTGSFAPRCYLAKEDVIVLEDLGAKGFAVVDDNGILLAEERLKAAARAQARLHAASYVTESILIKEQGKTFRDLAPTACQERVLDKTAEQLDLSKLLIVEWLARTVAGRNEPAAECAELLAGSLDGVFDWLYFENGKNLVICHGDTWSFNMMFDESEPPKCRLVDFQLTRYAPRAFDLAQMIYFTTTGETRAKYEDSAVEAYHLEFCETLRKNGFEPISTLAELQAEYEEARLAALFAAAIYYPSLMLSKEVHESFASPDDLYTEFVYRSSNEAVYALMERDETYEQRLSELALELLAHCKKLDAELKDREARPKAGA